MSTPPSGFVHLILLSRKEDPFYLEIPISIVTTLCLRPRKYLRYLGWCALGVIGTLTDKEGVDITLDGELLDQGTYWYRVPSDDDNHLAHAVDLEVIKQRSQVPSETTGTREKFGAKLLERDGGCVWSGGQGVGMYIIPFSRGEEWLRVIIANRTNHEDEDDTPFGINDIRNGIYAEDTLHNHHFDPRQVVVLKVYSLLVFEQSLLNLVPNPILETTDVPERYQRDILLAATYPSDSRYTLQWIIDPPAPSLARFPNNNDATFMDQSLRKPASILLHYNYGAAVVARWGKNTGVLSDRPDLPRPTMPSLAPMGPTGVVHDRSVTMDKRADITSQQRAGSERNTSQEPVDSEAQDSWDADDVMLFLWGNSRAARERHTQKERERNAYLEKWRASVTCT